MFGTVRTMRFLDRFLQRWRSRVALSWVPVGTRLLDVGCHQGEFLRYLDDRIAPSVGLDPLAETTSVGPHQIFRDIFQKPTAFPDESFDAVVMLAALEHIREKDSIADECARILRPSGRVIITVPSRAVDRLVDLLRWLRLIDGMSLEEHHGFDPMSTPDVFTARGFDLRYHQVFQGGLNHLFIFQKAASRHLSHTNEIG